MHLVFKKCVNVRAVNLQINAPEESPNTDGIHVTETQNILIGQCVIGTGITNGHQFGMPIFRLWLQYFSTNKM